MRYVYLGDKFTDPRFVAQPCDPIRRADGRVVVGSGVVRALGRETTVAGDELEQHEQLTETRSWTGEDGVDHTAVRAICGTCYREQEDRYGYLEYVNTDWPCEVKRLRERVGVLEAENGHLRGSVSSLSEMLTGYGDDDYAALAGQPAAGGA